MDPRTWPHQARWWTTEYGARGLTAATVRLSPSLQHRVLRALEESGVPADVDLAWPSRARDGCLVSSHVVTEPAVAQIPPDEAYVRQDGHHWSELRVHQLRDVVVDLQTGLVFHDGRVLTASGQAWRAARESAFASGAVSRVADPAPGAPWRQPVAPMGGVWNYYHFILEWLPRILRIAQVSPDAVPLFPGPLPTFATGVLDALRIDYRVVADGPAVRADDVWLCDPARLNWPHPADLQLLREVVAERVEVAPATDSERIYVSRSSRTRGLAGEPELERHLTALGFRCLRLEELAFADQVAAFRAARVVVADHGAGLANLVFMAPGTRVIEMTTGQWFAPSFRIMAHLLGIEYRLVTLPARAGADFGSAADAIGLLPPHLEVRSEPQAGTVDG